MALSSYVTSFNTGVAAAGNTVAVTGAGFTPKAAILIWSGDTSATDAAGRGSHYHGIGFVTSTTDRRCVGSVSLDNVTPDNAMWHINDACMVMASTTADTSTGRLDLSAWTADGATFIIDEQFSASLRVHVWFIGGSDIAAVETGVLQEPGGTGNQEINLAGAFKPEVVLFAHASFNAGANDWSTDSTLMVGAATATDQWTVIGMANDTTPEAMRHGNALGCIAMASSVAASTNARASIVSMDTDGFTINWSEVISTRWVHFLAIKGGNWKVGSVTTRTDGDDIAVTGLGGIFGGAFFASHCKGADAADTIAAHDVVSLGMASSTSQRGAIGTYDVDDPAGNSEVSKAVEHDAVYVRLAADGTVAGLMDLKSADADGATLVMDDTDPDAAFVGYAMVGAYPVMTASAAAFTLTGVAATTTYYDDPDGGHSMPLARRRGRR